MKTTTSTTVETTTTKRGRIVKAWTHTCTLECGHVEVRTDAGFGGAWSAPKQLKCSQCGR